jgi:hypothetical protein
LSGLSELFSASWALTRFLDDDTKERITAVEPLVVLVGLETPPEVQAYQKQSRLHVLTIESKDVLKLVLRAEGPEQLQALAREYLILPAIRQTSSTSAAR